MAGKAVRSGSATGDAPYGRQRRVVDEPAGQMETPQQGYEGGTLPVMLRGASHGSDAIERPSGSRQYALERMAPEELQLFLPL
ncbi:MAG TPA: hypothetical protein VNT24_07010, partial [Propionibacteriaceae bacterium]|nr:hypothetical protein [Propionibacteriaceae bacterium]